MNYRIVLVALLVAMGNGQPCGANETPEMERQFLDGLRSRGYSKLALQYLKQLQADAKLDAGLKRTLPVEYAKSYMSLALESPMEQRPGLYLMARKELTNFADQNKGHPQEVSARMQIARLAGLDGKAQLSKAVRQVNTASRKSEALKARILFEKAGGELTTAATVLTARIAGLQKADTEEAKAQLSQLQGDKLQVDFDLALNKLFQAQTYILSPDDKDVETRGRLAKEASIQLKEVSKRDEKHHLCYKARAWLIPCFLTMTEPNKAMELYDDLAGKKGIKTEDYNLDAKILADYFHLALIPFDPRYIKNPLDQMRKEGSAWLKRRGLATFGSTPDGYGIAIVVGQRERCFVPSSAQDVKTSVQFEVAEVAYAQGQALVKRQPATAAALFRQGQDQLKRVEESENDLTERARQLHLRIFVALRGGKIDPNQLKSFQDYSFLARHETNLYFEARTGEEKRQHLRNISSALLKALDHVAARTTLREIVRAGVDLADAYMNLGDYYRAAIVGEMIARTYPPSQLTAQAAGFALEAYVEILNLDQGMFGKFAGDEVLTDAVLRQNLETDRRRFRELALWVENEPAFQNEPVSQYAHYHRALLAYRENNLTEAVALLETLKPSWDGYPISQCQLVFWATRLAKEDAMRRHSGQLLGFELHWPTPLTDDERAVYQKKVWQTLKNLPTVTAQATPFFFHLYFAARLEHCKLLYRDRKYSELEKFTTQLIQQFDAHKSVRLKEDVKNNLRLGLVTWGNFARLGLAEEAYNAGKYDLVLDMTGATVTRVEELVKKAQPGSLKDFQLARDTLELALRANVQKNNRLGARKILDLLQKIAGDTNLTGGPTGIKPTEILVRLVLQLRDQVDALRQRKDKAAQEELKSTVANFAAFLDELTADLDKLTKQLDELSQPDGKKGQDNKALKARILGLLAKSYASLDKYPKAAELLSRIPQPRGIGGKEPTQREVTDYLETQLLYTRMLRQGKQYQKAEAVLRGVEKQLKGKLNLTLTLLSLEADKERIRILEAKEDFRQAITKLTAFMNNPRFKRLLADKDFQGILANYKDENDRKRMAQPLAKMHQDLIKIFFDSHYHMAYCKYMFGKNHSKSALREKWIRFGASHLLRIERSANKQGWELTKDRFKALLAAEPALKREYDKLKKAGN